MARSYLKAEFWLNLQQPAQEKDPLSIYKNKLRKLACYV